MHNYAFIDTQNLYLAIESQNWKLDSKKYSVLIKKTAKEKITSVSELKNKLEHKKSSTDKDQPFHRTTKS